MECQGKLVGSLLCIFFWVLISNRAFAAPETETHQASSLENPEDEKKPNNWVPKFLKEKQSILDSVNIEELSNDEGIIDVEKATENLQKLDGLVEKVMTELEVAKAFENRDTRDQLNRLLFSIGVKRQQVASKLQEATNAIPSVLQQAQSAATNATEELKKGAKNLLISTLEAARASVNQQFNEIQQLVSSRETMPNDPAPPAVLGVEPMVKDLTPPAVLGVEPMVKDLTPPAVLGVTPNVPQSASAEKPQNSLSQDGKTLQVNGTNYLYYGTFTDDGTKLFYRTGGNDGYAVERGDQLRPISKAMSGSNTSHKFSAPIIGFLGTTSDGTAIEHRSSTKTSVTPSQTASTTTLSAQTIHGNPGTTGSYVEVNGERYYFYSNQSVFASNERGERKLFHFDPRTRKIDFNQIKRVSN